MNNISRWVLKLVVPVAIIVALPLIAVAQSGSISQSAVFDTATVTLTDPDGVFIGFGEHSGEEHCINNNCNRKTQVLVDHPVSGSLTIEYRFETRQVLVPEDGLVIVAGTGTLLSGNQRERFQFTATIQDNGDGTLAVTYSASRPDASYIIPDAPGTFEISSRP